MIGILASNHLTARAAAGQCNARPGTWVHVTQPGQLAACSLVVVCRSFNQWQNEPLREAVRARAAEEGFNV